MNPQTIEINNPAPPAPIPTRTPAIQSRSMAERITAAAQIIPAAQQDAALLTQLTPYGYDADAFQQGLALVQAAQAAFNARQLSIAAKFQATAAMQEKFFAIQTAFYDYRRVGRALVRDSAGRTALGLIGDVTGDQQQLVQHARAVYHTALTMPDYAAAFAARGYSQEKFTALLAAMDEWLTLVAAFAQATAHAARATLTRNQAMEALDAWMHQLRIAGRIAAREHPEVLFKLGM